MPAKKRRSAGQLNVCDYADNFGALTTGEQDVLADIGITRTSA
jgi:hypothetical protein